MQQPTGQWHRASATGFVGVVCTMHVWASGNTRAQPLSCVRDDYDYNDSNNNINTPHMQETGCIEMQLTAPHCRHVSYYI